MKLADRLRLWCRTAALLGAVLLCVPLHLLFKLVRAPSPMPRIFLRLAARACGARASIAGRPERHDVFYLSNHVSWLDILVLGGASGCAFVSRDDVAGWPVVGWLARQNHTLFIARSRSALAGQLDTLRQALNRDQPIALFPEGTTGNGRELLPFKPALLSALLPPPRPIRVQPIFIDYGALAPDIAWTGDEAAGANAARVLARKGPLPVTVRFLDPFDPGDHSDRKAVSAAAEARIAERMALSKPCCGAI